MKQGYEDVFSELQSYYISLSISRVIIMMKSFLNGRLFFINPEVNMTLLRKNRR